MLGVVRCIIYPCPRYIPDAAQTQQALFGIRFFFAIVPVIAFVVAMPLLIWYPITRENHARLAEKPIHL